MRSEKSKSSLWLILPLFLTVSCNYQIEVHQKRGPTESTATATPTPVPYTQMSYSLAGESGSSNLDIPSCLVTDPADGSRYFVVPTTGPYTVGGTTYTPTSSTALVLEKVSRDGTLQWSKFILDDGGFLGLILNTYLSPCMTLADGKIFLAIITQASSLTIDSFSEPLIGNTDSYILGFNTADGSLAQHQHFGASGSLYYIFGLVHDGNTLYWSGVSTDSSITGPTPADCSFGCAIYGASDAHTGSLLWSRRWNSSSEGTSNGYGIAIGENHDLYLTGLYAGSGIDPGIGATRSSGSLSTRNGYIEKVSTTDGTPIWIREVTSSTNDIVTGASVQSDQNDSVYFSLSTNNSTDITIEGGGASSSDSKHWIISYDRDGNFRWVTGLPSTYFQTSLLYDPTYHRLFASCASGETTTLPILFQLDPSDGGTLKTDTVTGDNSGVLTFGLALDPSVSGLVALGLAVNTSTYEDQTIEAGARSSILMEWK